jgi:hypothetical protein
MSVNEVGMALLVLQYILSWSMVMVAFILRLFHLSLSLASVPPAAAPACSNSNNHHKVSTSDIPFATERVFCLHFNISNFHCMSVTQSPGVSGLHHAFKPTFSKFKFITLAIFGQ